MIRSNVLSSGIYKIKISDSFIHLKLDYADIQSPTIIFITGISGKGLTERFDYLAEHFTKLGYNFVRFNFRGQEEGSIIDNSCLLDELEDLRAVINFLESHQLIIQGFSIIAKSFGAVKAFLLNDKKLKCLCLLAPAVYIFKESNLLVVRNKKYGEINHMSDIHIPERFIQKFSISTLIIHGGSDTIIPISNSQKILELLPQEKQLYLLKGGEHNLDDTKEQRVESLAVLTSFIKRYFPL
jgi:pimeloyl-ACP methyl ester carboxylesterase